MNTPAHAVFNLALLGQKKEPQRNSRWNPLIIWGAIIPDLSMFGFYLWLRLATDIPEDQVWQVEYFKPAWQTLFDYFHSIPVALLGLGVMCYAQRPGMAFLFGSMVLHCLEDLPLHHDDAHRHFLPLSNFRFESPFSYWDPAHYGGFFGPLEMVLMVAASAYVFRRVRSRLTKGLLIVANALPLLTHLWFAMA
ncbi:MAG: hypothetical protein WBA76_16855 [Phormidesmis sp.]